MPVFTRVPSAPNLRVGALDRDVMQIREGSLKRPDLQFLAMLKDARKRLKEQGIKTHKKIGCTVLARRAIFARVLFSCIRKMCRPPYAAVRTESCPCLWPNWTGGRGITRWARRRPGKYRGGNLTRKTGNAPRSFITPSDVTTASPGPPRLLSGGRRGKLRWTCWAFLCRTLEPYGGAFEAKRCGGADAFLFPARVYARLDGRGGVF